MKIYDVEEYNRSQPIGLWFTRDLYFTGIDGQGEETWLPGKPRAYLRLNIRLPQWLVKKYAKWAWGVK